MKKKFTPYKIEDVQNFLRNRGIIWDGENLRANDHIILADVKLIEEDKDINAQIRITINETTFDYAITYQDGKRKLVYKDCSLDWLKARLEQYPNNAHTIYSVVTDEIETIQNNSEKEIEKLQQQINEIKSKTNAQVEHLSQFRNLAKSVIDSGITEPEEEQREL